MTRGERSIIACGQKDAGRCGLRIGFQVASQCSQCSSHRAGAERAGGRGRREPGGSELLANLDVACRGSLQ
jgi:hypothetical protein